MRLGLGVAIGACSLFTALTLVACAPVSDTAKEADSAPHEEATPTVEENTSAQASSESASAKKESSAGKLSGPADIGLHAVDEYGYYAFEYDGEEFLAFLQPDVWTVFDSYKVENHNDMLVICQALTNEYPIHGSDYASYRTAEDMAYEWEQHNFVYRSLPEGSDWRESAKDVDFDPSDQGKSYAEIYEDRTGRELDIAELLSR